jgi:hypothetical protein
MKDRDVVVATNQLVSDMWADETRSADNQNAHAQIYLKGSSTAATEWRRRQGSLFIVYVQFTRDHLFLPATAFVLVIIAAAFGLMLAALGEWRPDRIHSPTVTGNWHSLDASGKIWLFTDLSTARHQCRTWPVAQRPALFLF